MHLTTNVLGSFVIKNERVIKQRLFPPEPSKIAQKLRQTEQGHCKEEDDLIRELIETGNKKVYVTNPYRFRGSGFAIDFLDERERISIYKIANELYLERNDIDGLIRKVNRLQVRERLKEVERDQILIQAVDSLDDLDEAINRLIERLREWYSLHFPEIDDLIATHETYTKFVLEVGDRRGYEPSTLNFDPALSQKIARASGDSLGVDFSPIDLKGVKTLARSIIDLYKAQSEIESYLGELMPEIAPNINELAGPVLGARLISKAHGLQRLAVLPAGTIQLLGAEDAFFRFLKSGKKPPKHGIIFQLPAIRNAARNKRGKIARSFAAKLALASRADAFKGNFIAPKLKESFEKRVQEVNR
jgi:nucleolar protein 56